MTAEQARLLLAALDAALLRAKNDNAPESEIAGIERALKSIEWYRGGW